MTIRNVFLAASLFITLGVGISACSKSDDSAQSQSGSNSVASAISDSAMTAQVKAKLMTVKNLKDSDISVTTNNAVVTLEGTVIDSDAKAAAEDAAGSVDGVRSVRNNLNTSVNSMTMSDTQRVMSDSWITTKVKSELLADSISKGFDVSVETKQGVVTLKGELKNQEAIDHVKKLAAGVEGVKNVEASALTIATGM